MNAPVCPVSSSQIGQLPPHIVKLINQIPRAHDLLSATLALHRINNVLIQITHSPPQVNNKVVGPLPHDVTLLGMDNNPRYSPANWVEEERHYTTHHAVNPNDK